MSAIDSRDAIYSISRAVGYTQASGTPPPLNVTPDSDGDTDRDAAAGVVGNNRPGGLVQGMLQSLDRLGLNASNQINPNADADSLENRSNQEPGLTRQDFKAFTQSLLQTLDQFNRTKASEVSSRDQPNQPTGQPTDASYGAESSYGDLPTTLRSLANALTEGTATSLSAVADLQGRFDELTSQLATKTTESQGSEPIAGVSANGSEPATLGDFLTNLSEVLANQNSTANMPAGKTGMLIDQTV